ncbi:MAG TPA: outer membrane protein assembly factor BamC [Bacteroidota bacterium]|nr:outer membrane protein assembly factor BamC [Bacteroidota bacterium]
MVCRNVFAGFLVLLSGITMIIFCGCAGSKQENFDYGSYKKIFANNQDNVWAAVSSYLKENDIPIKEADQSSETIVTEYWHDPAWTEDDIVGADCREPEGVPEYKSLNVSVQFTVFVKPAGENQTSVQVNAVFRGVLKYQSTFGEPIEKEIGCFSNGKLEAKILEYISGKK